MKNVVEYENKVLIQWYMEIIAWATFFGLLFPLIFLLSNKKEIPQAENLSLFVWILIVLCLLLYVFSTGKIFPQKISHIWIRLILYAWGLGLLGLTARLVYCTGGVQSSIFNWLFEYALIVALVVRPKKHEQAFLKQWRPVIVVAVFEILILVILVSLGERSIRIPKTMDELMPIWGGISIISALIISVFLFYISEKILKIRS